jgi:undecaprenyl-diphosphatase
MDIIKVIILGMVQGLTEFLPVSSSGHLVLAAEILNFHEEGVAFEVFVHLGTLLSVLIVFRQDVIKMIIAPLQYLSSRFRKEETKQYLLWDLYIIIGTIPAAVIGLSFKSSIEAAFSNILLVILMLAITGTLLLLSRFIPKKNEEMTFLKSLLIGVSQAFAILPGISRSGSTIVTGIFLGINKENAARFSFLLAIPAILGASVIKLKDIIAMESYSIPFSFLLIGAIVSFISGYFAIIWLLDIVKKGKLEWFAYYCYLVVGASTIWYTFLR